MKIKRIKIFANKNDKSLSLKDEVANKLIENDFEIVDNNFDLGIAIGGDGSFLRMIKDNNFDSDTYYIGINAGTLGFAQEVEINDIEEFINDLKEDQFLVEEIGIQESTIYNENNKMDEFYSLNEIVVREKTLNTLKLDVFIDNYLLENFAGDGILVATSFGTTAYNLSFGGSIIYNTFHALELTTIAPLNNKTYKTISNSIVLPQNKNITLLPTKTDNLIVTVDGVNKVYDNVIKIETIMKDKTIKCLRNKDYNFIKKINEKFIK
jgi:NAD+ kinase